MGTSRGKNKQELASREKQTQAAIQQWQPTELEKLQSDNTLNFLKDMQSGKDVKDISGVAPFMDLFNGAKNNQAAEKMGGGIMGAANGNASGMATALAAQNQRRKEEAASGGLMNAVSSAYQNATQVLAPSLMGMAENRNAGRVNFFGQRESEARQLANRPNPWLQVLQSGMQAAGTAAAAL